MKEGTVDQQLESFFFDRINYERQQPLRYDQRHFRLDPLKFLLEKLGNPHQTFRSIHVTGTKGKGSVSAYLEAMFQGHELKTAVYSSPHIESVCERYRINGHQIDSKTLFKTVEIIKPAVEFVDRMSQADPEFGSLTFFDLCTATAFQLFALQKINVGIIEVGMGGRLDSTNVISPSVSVITNISLDHTQQLGDTTAKIAFEKAGIIKPETPIVTATQDDQALEVIRRASENNKAPISIVGKQFAVKETNSKTKFSFRSLTGQGIDIETDPISLPKHQLENIATAYQAFSLFCEQHQLAAELNPKQVLSNAFNVNLPGRIEVLKENPLLILDMAHNPLSFQALIDSIKLLEKTQPQEKLKRTLILSCASDKDISSILSIAADFFDRIITTRFSSNPRSATEADYQNSKNQMASQSSSQKIRHIDSLPDAFREGIGRWEKGETTVFAGSIFLVSEVKNLFR